MIRDRSRLGVVLFALLAMGSGVVGGGLYQHTLTPDSGPQAYLNGSEDGDELPTHWVQRQPGNRSVPPGSGTVAPRSATVAMPPTVDLSQGAQAAIPCVVTVQTVAQPQEQSYFDLFFYGNPGRQTSSGSGVIMSANGYIVTNNHVIDGAEVITVQHKRRSYPARVIGTDPSTDLALLKIEATGLPAIRQGDSRQLAVGEWVMAVGNPFNLTSTVTAGIVSAKGRNINLLSAQSPIESFIQTDAAINPGNSGGALVNARGQLVGINTAIFSRTGSYTGYGFAVPSDIVKKVVEDLIQYGTVQKGYLGIDVTEVDAKQADAAGLAEVSGVVVTRVMPESPAAGAGLKVGDILLRLNDVPLEGRGSYDEELSYYNPGDRVSVTYRRGKASTTVPQTLVNRDGTTERVRRQIFSSKTLGADMETVPRIERDRLGVNGGVRVVKAHAGGLARRLGIEEGFIILRLNRQEMGEPVDVERAFSNIGSQLILEGVTRNGQRVERYFGY